MNEYRYGNILEHCYKNKSYSSINTFDVIKIKTENLFLSTILWTFSLFLLYKKDYLNNSDNCIPLRAFPLFAFSLPIGMLKWHKPAGLVESKMALYLPLHIYHQWSLELIEVLFIKMKVSCADSAHARPINKHVQCTPTAGLITILNHHNSSCAGRVPTMKYELKKFFTPMF